MAELAAERFRNAAEANMDAFAIMEALRGGDGRIEDFRVVYINAEAERMWQISRREAIGSQFRQLGIALQIPDFFDSCRRVVENGQAVSEEIPMAFNIDHPSWMHHEIVKAGDGVSVSVRDITQRKLAELDLALREALLKTVTDSIPALVAFIDREERYRYCNKSYMRLFGIRPEQIIGVHMRDFLGDETYQQLRLEVEKALSGQPSSFERDMSVRGENRYVEGRYIPQQHADGSVSGFYVMIWDITQSRARELELRNKVTLDGMTGLLNRSAFMEMLDDEIKHHYVKRLAVALLFLDIDHFKQVNDTLGHAAGDELIQEFARRLRSQVRATDHVARLGGDEFVILLAGLESERTAIGVAEKLLEAVSHDVELAGQRRKLSTSIGVAYAAMPDITPERLLQIADEALYQAKAAGRNTYRLHRVG
nr:sensor domain-containing diguanylate cyclase [Chromobacterium sp. ASV23]